MQDLVENEEKSAIVCCLCPLWTYKSGQIYGRVPCKPTPRTWSGGEPSSHKRTVGCVWQTRPSFYFKFVIFYLLFGVMLMDKYELQNRTKEFAHRCVRLCLALPRNVLCNHVQGQLIRASTSVAANYRAACIAQSKKAFEAKLGIVIEEASESLFWLEFLLDEGILNLRQAGPLFNESQELTAIFVASRNTLRKAQIKNTK
jgi:four helix bundle protein